MCADYLHAKADHDRNILWSLIRLRQISGVCKNVEFCCSAATISASNRLHVALSQHHPSSLLSVFILRVAPWCPSLRLFFQNGSLNKLRSRCVLWSYSVNNTSPSPLSLSVRTVTDNRPTHCRRTWCSTCYSAVSAVTRQRQMMLDWTFVKHRTAPTACSSSRLNQCARRWRAVSASWAVVRDSENYSTVLSSSVLSTYVTKSVTVELCIFNKRTMTRPSRALQRTHAVRQDFPLYRQVYLISCPLHRAGFKYM